MEYQKTIGKEVTYKGVGLHTGNDTMVRFKPAPPNSGIKFVRVDLDSNPIINGNVKNVVDVVRGTTIGNGSAKIHTVEHLLAALYGLGIDNVIIEIDANEPPVGDGSSLPFVKTLERAGIVQQDEQKRYINITQPIHFSRDDVHIIAFPSNELKISCTIHYNHPILTAQYASYTINPDVFSKEIAPARTFCFDFEIETLKKKGLAKGGTLDNAIVIGETGIHNKGLRFKDECVRHKILDLLGDLYLLGGPLKAHIVAVRCGHANNITFIKEIVKFISNNNRAQETEKRESLPKMMEGGGLEGIEELDVEAIKRIIPHRDPFLFVDKVIILEPNKRAVGIKNVDESESYLRGHFPGRPIMPGVLIVESMAQTSCVLFLSRPDLSHKLAYFMAINNVKFRKPVLPGAQLMLDVEVIRARERGGKVNGKAYVGKDLVSEAEFMFSLVDK